MSVVECGVDQSDRGGTRVGQGDHIDDVIQGGLQGHLTTNHCRGGLVGQDYLYQHLRALFDSIETARFRIAFVRQIQKGLEALGPK